MKKIRFLLSRDDWYHQRGYWVLASALKDAGLEVVLGGIQTPQDVIHTAIEENVDIIGYRIMDAAPAILIPMLLDGMRKGGIQDIPVVVGGIIPRKDEIIIRDLGVREVFHPYTPLDMVVSRVKEVAVASQAKRG